jgi:hypothetical protein
MARNNNLRQMGITVQYVRDEKQMPGTGHQERDGDSEFKMRGTVSFLVNSTKEAERWAGQQARGFRTPPREASQKSQKIDCVFD